MSKQLTIDEILKQLDIDSHSYHDGPWDYNGPTPSQKAKSAINKIVMDIIGEEVCFISDIPAIDEMIRIKLREDQRNRARQYGLGGKDETLA